MTTALSRQLGSAFELTLTIPWPEVKAVYDQVFNELASQIEIEGFRKGNAPKDLVAAKVDKNKVYSEVINRLLPDSYAKALEEHRLQPIVSPKVQIVSADEEKDWQFLVKAAEKPKVDLQDYKSAVAALNSKGKIWTPDSASATDKPGTPDPAKTEEQKSKRLREIIDKLLETSRVELPEILLESEVSRLLTQLIDDVRQAGLTYEQYLTSSGQTAEQIREKYRAQAEASLKLEFVLTAVADDLGIQVSPEEISAVIDKETDPQKKQSLKEQSYLLSSIIRRENTVNRLLAL